MNLQTKLRKWRKREELSQSEAAARLGCNVATLRNWEQGRNAPRGLALAHLEQILAGARVTDESEG